MKKGLVDMIPVYNRDVLLVNKAIKSALNQTYIKNTFDLKINHLQK